MSESDEDYDDEYDPDFSADCYWCGGDGWVECDDPMQCTYYHDASGLHRCSSCGGTGCRKDQTIWYPVTSSCAPRAGTPIDTQPQYPEPHSRTDSPQQENDMGFWRITVEGHGCHHNSNRKIDADLAAADFVAELKAQGHEITKAEFELTGFDGKSYATPAITDLGNTRGEAAPEIETVPL